MTTPFQEYRTIALSMGKVAIVDSEDFELLSREKWFANRGARNLTWYAVCSAYKHRASGRYRTLLKMHRVVLGISDPKVQIDHVNGDGLDNRKANLRIATHTENQQNRGAYSNNTSGYKGVAFARKCSKWQASISISGKDKFLGYFASAAEAHRAYCSAAAVLRGKFGRTE